MIPSTVWIEGLARTAGLIAGGVLEDVWSNNIEGATSISDFSELIVQVFDDLDSDNLVAQFRGSRLYGTSIKDAAENFLKALKQVDEQVKLNSINSDRDVVKLAQWHELETAALRLHREYARL